MSDSIVTTRGGDLRGRFADGVHSFIGVRYGEDTAPRRFRKALPVAPWDGVCDAVEFGAQCIQPSSPDFELLASGWDQPTPSSEDCLFLNIWTPALGDDGRRPVMVNFHGGAWTVGNGNSGGRSGETFARHHDVVRVNLNHRLGIFGYANVSGLLGPDFADSGTVGILDAVLALEWIRDNIAAFGGDPDNVTIFGVSGGGQKVSTLMAMPAAKGLFHRASVESGPMTVARLAEPAAEMTKALFAALEIPSERARDILHLDGEALLAGYMKMFPDGGLTSSGIAPVVDGTNLPAHPFEPGAPEISRDVPLMIGTTLTETSIFEEFLGGSVDGIGWEDVADRVSRFVPPGAPFTTQGMIEAARRDLPESGPATILYVVTTEILFRSRSRQQADRAAARPGAVYTWLLEWITPVDGGKWGSPHGLSVPLVMDTVDRVSSMFGGDLVAPQALADTMSSAWAAFARTGVPAAEGLPSWPRYEAGRRETMIFDTISRVESDPLPELRRALEPGEA